MTKRKKIGICILTGLVLTIIIATLLPSIYSPGAKETEVRNKVLNLISNQLIYFKNEKRYASAEEFRLQERQIKDYKLEMVSDGKSFQIWATPINNSGRISFYADSNDGDIRGANRQGEKANENDPIVYKIPEDSKEMLRQNKLQK